MYGDVACSQRRRRCAALPRVVVAGAGRALQSRARLPHFVRLALTLNARDFAIAKRRGLIPEATCHAKPGGAGGPATEGGTREEAASLPAAKQSAGKRRPNSKQRRSARRLQKYLESKKDVQAAAAPAAEAAADRPADVDPTTEGELQVETTGDHMEISVMKEIPPPTEPQPPERPPGESPGGAEQVQARDTREGKGGGGGRGRRRGNGLRRG